MHALRFASRAVLIFALAAAAAAQASKPYPGATKYTPPDTDETRQAAKALPPGTTSATYITNDSFDKVVAFYKALGKQYNISYRPKLPNGQEMQQTFILFDGAADLRTSKNWAKIQRPFVGSVDFKGGAPQYKDIRDVTEITLAEKK